MKRTKKRKNKINNRKSKSKSKKYIKVKKSKYNRRRYGGMKKRVSFGEVEEREFVTPPVARDSRDLELRLQRPCPSLNRLQSRDFPCKYKNTVFANAYEFAEWYKEYLSTKIMSAKEKEKHLEDVKRRLLEETGRWESFLPEPYRSYDEATGVIEDVRPFAETDEEESRRLLDEKRRERKSEQGRWMKDVQMFKEKKRREEEEEDNEGSYF